MFYIVFIVFNYYYVYYKSYLECFVYYNNCR